jgi:hypothetical protein
MRLSPAATNQLAVPAQQGARRHQEHSATLSWQEHSQARQQATIGVVVTRTRNPAFQDRHLVAKHSDLDIFVVRSRPEAQHAEGARRRTKNFKVDHIGAILAGGHRRWSGSES